MIYNVNLDTDWHKLPTYVFKEFKTIEDAEKWTTENMDKIKTKAKSQRVNLGIFEPIKRRVNITNHPNEFGLDIATLYITV